MSFTEKWKKQVLVVLLVALVVSLYFSRTSGRTEMQAEPDVRVHAPHNSAAAADRSDEKVLLGLLSIKHSAPFGGVHRNVFQFGEGEGNAVDEEVPQAALNSKKDQTMAGAETAPAAPEARYMGFYRQRD